jgi:hypothetical protein
MDKKYLLAALPGIFVTVGAVLVATAFLEDIQSIAYAGYVLLAVGVAIAIALLVREGKKRNWSWARIAVNLLFVFGAVSMVVPVVFGAFRYKSWWLFVLGWITSGLLMLMALLLGRKITKERPAKERELDERALLIRSEASSTALASSSMIFVFLVSLSAMVDISWVIPATVQYLSISVVYAVAYLYFRKKRGG